MTAVEWLVDQMRQRKEQGLTLSFYDLEMFAEKAKEMEKEQQNNLPIHIHEGISNTHVYIEDGVVHVKPNETFK